MSNEVFLAYMEQAEGLIRDQQRLIEEQRKTIEYLYLLSLLHYWEPE